MTHHSTIDRPDKGILFRARARHAALVFVVAGSLALAAGCASLYSEKAGSGRQQGVGVPYSLPKGVIAMTVKFTGANSTAGEVTKTNENTTTKKTVSKGETVDTTEDTVSSKVTDTSKTTGSPTPTVISVDTQVSFVPNTGKTYFIRQGSNALHETDMAIHVSNGLLTSINATDRSKVEGIITTVAQTAAYAVEFASGGTPAGLEEFTREGRVSEKAALPKPKPDRPSKSDVDALLKELAGTSYSFTHYQEEANAPHFNVPHFIEPCIGLKCVLKKAGGTAAGYEEGGKTVPGGVFVRTLAPYTCTITLKVDGRKYGKAKGLDEKDYNPVNLTIYRSQTTVLLPDTNSLVLIPTSRSFFGDTKDKLELDRGILTSCETARPSEVYAAAQIPLNVVKAVIASVSELLTLRVTVNNNKTALAESEAALKEKQADVEKRLDKLEAKSSQ
jgi:hypothetical protein